MTEYEFSEQNSRLGRWMNLVGRIVAGNRLIVLFGATCDGRIVQLDPEIGNVIAVFPGASQTPVRRCEG